MLETLTQLPSLRRLELSYDVPIGRDENLPPLALKGNLKLTTLNLNIKWAGDTLLAGNLNLKACKTMILEAPALKKLTLKRTGWSETSGANTNSALPHMYFSENEPLPPIEDLTLRNYRLGCPDAIENRLQDTQLRTLNLSGVYLEDLSVYLTRLTSRQHVRLKEFILSDIFRQGPISVEDWQKTLNNFLLSFTGLERLVLCGDAAVSPSVLDGISRHGKTLQVLELGRLPVQGHLSQEIRYVNDICPGLMHLTLDLCRDLESGDFVSGHSPSWAA